VGKKMKHKQAFKQHLTGLLFLLSLVNVPFFSATAQNPPYNPSEEIRKITGYWMTEDKDGVVAFYDCNVDLCGKFHWLEEDSPESPSLDDKNTDPDKRSRPLCGLTFMEGFKPQGDGLYTGGWIYSPRDGGTYSANLKLLDSDTLELRGYIFIPLLGKSQYWHRTGTKPSCTTNQETDASGSP
jgi:uncharacterized protein (DUF2147 family)